MMQAFALVVFVSVAAAVPGEEDAPGHGANANYQALVEKGVSLGGVTVQLPKPVLLEGMSAEEERKALEQVAGSKAAVGDLLRKSVTAPQVLKVHDQKAPQGDIIRLADLW